MLAPIGNYKLRIRAFFAPIFDAIPQSLKNFIHSALKRERRQEDDYAEDASAVRQGIFSRLIGEFKSFKSKIRELSDLQKLILLTIAVCLPAGILVSTMLLSFFKRHRS